MDFKMSPIIWLTATVVAGIAMVAYASGYIYTRNEGVLLEKRVDNFQHEIRRRLERIEDKIDRLKR